GADVVLHFENPDDMIHNVVIGRPGARVAIVEAAANLGAAGPEQHYVPRSDDVLWATPLVNPGEHALLRFTAPASEGVYPYVCTFPGHGFVMYGAMYVASHAHLPPLAEDSHVPPAAPTLHAESAPPSRGTERAVLIRTFLPDTGPASIAVGLP